MWKLFLLSVSSHAVTLGIRLFSADIRTVLGCSIPAFPLRVVNARFIVHPDDSVIRTVPLGLLF
jgi:hypothetical protein